MVRTNSIFGSGNQAVKTLSDKVGEPLQQGPTSGHGGLFTPHTRGIWLHAGPLGVRLERVTNPPRS